MTPTSLLPKVHDGVEFESHSITDKEDSPPVVSQFPYYARNNGKETIGITYSQRVLLSSCLENATQK